MGMDGYAELPTVPISPGQSRYLTCCPAVPIRCTLSRKTARLLIFHFCLPFEIITSNVNHTGLFVLYDRYD